MPRTPDLKLHARWRERVRLQSQSGLTISQYCIREGISAAAFHAWKRRLRLINLADRRAKPPAPPAFVPITLQASADPPVIEADLPNGVRLRFPTADAHLACRLVRLVARARSDAGGPTC
jgi:hypothetical protein